MKIFRRLRDCLTGAPSLKREMDRTGQVLRCSVPEAKSALLCFSTLRELRAVSQEPGYLPAAFLSQKAKIVSDGIVAALELLSHHGDERWGGLYDFVQTLLETPGPSANEYLASVSDLGKGISSDRPLVRGTMDSTLNKPLGFYIWNDEFRRSFLHDRLLQRELSLNDAIDLAQRIHSKKELRDGYSRHLDRAARLTNPFSPGYADLRKRIGLLDENSPEAISPLPSPIPGLRIGEAVVPPSWAVENEYDSVADFFAAVRSGECDLTPSPDAGFYAHQIYCLDALLRPGQLPEARYCVVDATYAKELERLAAGILFFARETHVKQIQVVQVMAAPVLQMPKIFPNLTIEPLPTFYTRTADAFRFLRSVIIDGWGESALSARQWRSEGEVSATIDDGIQEVVELHEAASKLSRYELFDPAMRDCSKVDQKAWRAHLSKLSDDSDLDRDTRGMVPLEVMENGEIRVLVFAGWELQRLMVNFKVPPKGKGLSDCGIEFHMLPVPLTKEIIVRELLDPQEMRAMGDQWLKHDKRVLVANLLHSQNS